MFPLSCGTTFFEDNERTVWVHGYNSYGSLGVGDKIIREIPHKLNWHGGNIVGACFGAYRSILLDSDGILWTSGDTKFSEAPKSLIFQKVEGLPFIHQVGGCSKFAVALDIDGLLWIMKIYRNMSMLGEIGVTMETHKPLVFSILHRDTFVKVSNCGRLTEREDGKVFTIHQHFTDKIELKEIKNLPDGEIQSLHTNTHIKAILYKDGSLWMNYNRSIEFKKEENIPSIKQVTMGGYFIIALDFDGIVWSWGYRLKLSESCFYKDCTLKEGGQFFNPKLFPGYPKIQSVAAGFEFAMGISEDHKVLVTGYQFPAMGVPNPSNTRTIEYDKEFIGEYPLTPYIDKSCTVKRAMKPNELTQD